MPTDNLEYLTINDFTPGIRHRVNIGGAGDSSKSPPGAADPLATFRCIALPGGGLGPLPKMVQTKTRSDPGTATDDIFRISGFHVTGPMYEHDYESVVQGVDNGELHIAYEWYGATHKWFWERYHLWHSTQTNETIKDHTATHPASFDELYRPTSFVDARMHATDATELGDLFVVAGWHPDDMDSPDNIWLIFPDPDVPNATGTQAILTVNETTILVQHQGRVVSVDNHVFAHGGTGFWVVNDQLVWTQVNLPTVEEDPPGTIVGVGVFTQGPVSGYGAACSASAQELLLVKHRGGATTISGDLDDPTVFSLPGVASTRGAVTYGVYTPIGFIYGVRYGGIHAWTGGDRSEKISKFLDDDFYMMRPSDWRDFDGQLDIWGDYILVPKNWLYDIVTESWWRIEDPADYQIFQWSSAPQSSNFYGAPATMEDGSPIWYRFDASTPVADYEWRSQYLAFSLDRVIDVREISVRALAADSGTSTITITISDEAGNTQSETFTPTQVGIPKLLRKNTSFRGSGLKVKIEASTTGSNPAPTVLEVNLGYRLGQQEAIVA